MGQCCAADQSKGTTDGMAPEAPFQKQVTRKLESATKTESMTASFSTDASRERSDTYAMDMDGRGSARSSSFIKNMNLEIQIPADGTNAERNPDFKTPAEGQVKGGAQPVIEEIEDDQSEMMVMQPSDSMSSMGSQMVRMDSQQVLSQNGSLQNLQEINRDVSKAKLAAAGSSTQFVTVNENENESADEEESVIQRIENNSDDESVMQRVGDAESEASGIMQRVGGDGMSSSASGVMRREEQEDGQTSQSESLMQRVEDGESSVSGQSFNMNAEALRVPKELRNLGRAQASVADLENTKKSLAFDNGVRSTANLATTNAF